MIEWTGTAGARVGCRVQVVNSGPRSRRQRRDHVTQPSPSLALHGVRTRVTGVENDRGRFQPLSVLQSLRSQIQTAAATPPAELKTVGIDAYDHIVEHLRRLCGAPEQSNRDCHLSLVDHEDEVAGLGQQVPEDDSTIQIGESAGPPGRLRDDGGGLGRATLRLQQTLPPLVRHKAIPLPTEGRDEVRVVSRDQLGDARDANAQGRGGVLITEQVA